MDNNIISEIKNIRKKNKAGYYYCTVIYSDGSFYDSLYHRILMEQYLNRRLSKHELVEFIDQDRANFNISNLRLTTRSSISRRIASSELRDQIIKLIYNGKSYKEISEELGCGKATVSYHAKNYNLNSSNKGIKLIDNYDWITIQKYYDLGYTIRKCCSVFGFSKRTWDKAVELGYIISRESENSNNQIFCENSQCSTKIARRRILRDNLIPYECNECGIENFWNGKTLVLQLDHINGIRNDHRLENLRFLCPNCHSQTETFCGKNFPEKRFNEEQVIKIKKALEDGETVRSLSKKYNVDDKTISSIKFNKTYKYL